MGGGMGGMGEAAPAGPVVDTYAVGAEPPLTQTEVELMDWSDSVERRWSDLKAEEHEIDLISAVWNLPEVQNLRPGSAEAIHSMIGKRTEAYYAEAIQALEARTGRKMPLAERQENIDYGSRYSVPMDHTDRYYQQDIRTVYARAAQRGRELSYQLGPDQQQMILEAARAGVDRRTRLQPNDIRYQDRLAEEYQDLGSTYTMGGMAASGIQRPYHRVPAVGR